MNSFAIIAAFWQAADTPASVSRFTLSMLPLPLLDRGEDPLLSHQTLDIAGG